MTNRRLHPAWIVLGAVTVCLLASSGLRATFGVYIKPIEAEMGWSRGALSIAAAISLLLLGATGPFAGRLADRWGPRRVIVIRRSRCWASAAVAMSFVHNLWQLYLTAGVRHGRGRGRRGAEHGLRRRRALVRYASGHGDRRRRRRHVRRPAHASSRSPPGSRSNQGWRSSVLWLGLGLLAIVLPLAAWFIRNTPEERGVRPYGATGVGADGRAGVKAAQKAGRVSVTRGRADPAVLAAHGHVLRVRLHERRA